MRKISKLIIVVLMSILLVGCFPKPESKLQAYLDSIKTMDLSSENTLYLSDYFDTPTATESTLNIGLDQSTTTYSQAFTDRYVQLFQGFEYTLGKSTVEGDKASVELTITTYPMGDLMRQYIMNIITNSLTWAFSGMSEEEMNQKMNDSFIELTDTAEMTYTKTVTVYLVKGEKDWLMVGGTTNNDLFNALTGGMIDLANSMK